MPQAWGRRIEDSTGGGRGEGQEDVDVFPYLQENDGSSFDGSESHRRRASSSSMSDIDNNVKSKKSTAQMTRELTDLYRHAIAQTSDGTLGYDDIRTLVTDFAGIDLMRIKCEVSCRSLMKTAMVTLQNQNG